MNSIHRAVVLAALAAPSFLRAQSNDLGPLVLRLPSSTRALATGNVAVVGRDDDVLFYNPAQLVAARGMSMSMEQFSTSARAGTLSSVTRFSTGGIAVGATFAQFDNPILAYPIAKGYASAFGPGQESAVSFVVGIGQVIKSTRIGASGKFVEERIGQAHSARGVVDVGLGRDFLGYNFGLAVQNIGPSFDSLFLAGASPNVRKSPSPLRTTIGAGHVWNTDVFDISGTAAVSVLRDGFVAPAGGGEVSYSWLDGYTVILRAGGRRPEHGEGPLTAGLGLVVDRLSIDYALETLSDSRFAHRIGLRIR